jgi:hypothetical protein
MHLASSSLAGFGLVLAAAGALPPAQDRLPEPAPLSRAAFVGHTLNAVTFGRGSRGASVEAVMWQAFFQADGTAVIRRWDTTRNAYAPAARSTWSLDGERLCLGLSPAGGSAPDCVDLHGWGTSVGGIGADGRSMLKGDLKRGNLVLSTSP